MYNIQTNTGVTGTLKSDVDLLKVINDHLDQLGAVAIKIERAAIQPKVAGGFNPHEVESNLLTQKFYELTQGKGLIK